MDYIGLKCGICGKDFAENDDVVVCPDCGTPMHRACFKEKGECPNLLKHADGFVFDEFNKITESAKGIKKNTVKPEKKDSNTSDSSVPDGNVCPICGNKNREKANFCDNCGTRLSGYTPPTFQNISETDYTDPTVFASFTLGQASDVSASAEFAKGVTAGDLACYVGVNTPYYLNAFKRIKSGSGKFNFGAALFSGVWFLYRKLYKFGVLLLSIEALLYALNIYFTQGVSLQIMNKLLASIGLSADKISTITAEQYVQLGTAMQNLPFKEQLAVAVPTLLVIAQIILMIVSGAIANKVYFKTCVSNIRDIKKRAAEESLTRSEVSKSLYLAGGVNAIAAGAFGFIYLFLIFVR